MKIIFNELNNFFKSWKIFKSRSIKRQMLTAASSSSDLEQKGMSQKIVVGRGKKAWYDSSSRSSDSPHLWKTKLSVNNSASFDIIFWNFVPTCWNSHTKLSWRSRFNNTTHKEKKNSVYFKASLSPVIVQDKRIVH